MGCGESKHHVATENTITKIKSRRSSKPADGSIRTTKVAETIPQNDKNPHTSLTQQQQEESKTASLYAQQRQGEDQGKDKEQSKKPKEENSETQNVNENSASNRQEELFGNAETVEAIISDGISGKTEYHSPRSYDVGFGGLDGEKSSVDQEETKVERETENGAGNPGKVNEAETEALATSTVQERTVNDNKETAL